MQARLSTGVPSLVPCALAWLPAKGKNRPSRACARAFGAAKGFNTLSKLIAIRAFYAYMYAIVMYALVEMI